MKKLALISLFSFIYCIVTAQGITKITGTVAGAEDSILKVTLRMSDPFLITRESLTTYEMEVGNGKFEFAFNISKPTNVSVFINDKFLVFPGVYEMLMEPSDSIHVSVPEMKTAGHFGFGIVNIGFSGRGSDKLNMTKAATGAMLDLFNKDPKYALQSLTYKYESSDRKFNAIDAALKSFKGNISPQARDIIKGQLYDGVFYMLFISSLQSENDSLRYLFNKYIVQKKRIDVFFKSNVIYYHGGAAVSDYIQLSEFKNPYYVGGDVFRQDRKLEFAKMAMKYLKDKPIVRDYQLSRQTLTYVEAKMDNPDVRKMYQFYLDQVDARNPFFKQVKAIYDHAQSNFRTGTPFYKFALPDSTGKIHQLADFKGNVVVMDFWFNGCGGCKAMAPAMDELEEEMKNENIRFVSVGVDERKYWLQGIGKYSGKKTLQLYTEDQEQKHPFIKHLNLYAYPQLVVVDKNGNIAGIPPDPRTDKVGFRNFVRKFM
ncbi:TlpA family protein disulfide reductase [Pseudobacter ginsenosidimutans]|uniref:Thiol-disulfide isomerase/thioredoxin n=1 Tax=Pseudobacter ginsenosidimutans TaxID=661488 RepID=A0A4Q7ML50_9BACT|nr:TlpA disulfide reductase family protein [Pseudobacter ginsenosidimutans]QEC40250.1 TlpA family protein disulfide reductase [Pseudobacter ginsenosidimutans]RZS69151.1 thiol-disulfide isomerase/thioredoxin [Pseudobacter ginsenosidimutans]